jgi:hypothetical protein
MNKKLDVMVIELKHTMTDEEIKDSIRGMLPICRKNKLGFCLSIQGFDFDPRELWEIPEAINFTRRLCTLGFISTLEVSTTCKALMTTKELPGFGALEVWLCAVGKMDLNIELSKETMIDFLNDLQKSNALVTSICQEPSYNTNAKLNIRSSAMMPDAPVRYRGFNHRWK